MGMLDRLTHKKRSLGRQYAQGHNICLQCKLDPLQAFSHVLCLHVFVYYCQMSCLSERDMIY